MESGTEELFYQDREPKTGIHPEAEDIYNRIRALSSEQKAHLIHKVIVTLTVKELAEVLDETAARLRNIDRS